MEGRKLRKGPCVAKAVPAACPTCLHRSVVGYLDVFDAPSGSGLLQRHRPHRHPLLSPRPPVVFGASQCRCLWFGGRPCVVTYILRSVTWVQCAVPRSCVVPCSWSCAAVKMWQWCTPCRKWSVCVPEVLGCHDRQSRRDCHLVGWVPPAGEGQGSQRPRIADLKHRSFRHLAALHGIRHRG